MSGAIAAQQKVPLAKPLIIMTSNNISQVLLWLGLGLDLWSLAYGPGMWATFGIGMLFVWVAGLLQWRVLCDLKERGVKDGRRLLARLLFLSLMLGGVGNAIDLGIMGVVAQVPLGVRDWQLAGIAAAAYIAITLLCYVGRPLAPKLPLPPEASRFRVWRAILFSPERPYRDTRWKFTTGLSVRVAPQAGAAFFALHDHVKPMGEKTLILLSLVMLTFAIGFWLQQRGKNPSAEALAGFALYGLNFVITLALTWAFVAASR